ncbi:conserved hypothetical protein [Cyclobacterium lianum]|uniref:Glycosyltransferase n=1 Tax=Cyclobacterium lianum TaxID=388280 RepID=A0A1M7NXB7_9BACT|nr:glycosyltransferase family protein [Cyclobacterium lianum]SHN08669.1 conserved hypothetical protein [Cyclobacterium lianum]
MGKKFLFIVQGEGRGHMTQAIIFEQLLREKGHEVSAVIIGTSRRRKIPEYVDRAFGCRLHKIQSPNFLTDKGNKRVRIGATLFGNLGRLPVFLKSLKCINQLVHEHRPDCIVNFYDLLGGIYMGIYRPDAKTMVIGHQYLASHRDFTFAKPGGLLKSLFRINTKITSLGADKTIALSLWEPEPQSAPSGLLVWPPLIKAGVKSTGPVSGDYYLVYIVNSGYAREIFDLAKRFPEIKIEAFWDEKEMPERYQPLANLIFHQVDDHLFLEKLSGCKAYLSTAGFESIAEALYLGKKILVVPVEGQYEQKCNSLDAERSGAGIAAGSFDLPLLGHYLKNHSETDDVSRKFRAWESTLDAHFHKLMVWLESEDEKTVKKGYRILAMKNNPLASSFSK